MQSERAAGIDWIGRARQLQPRVRNFVDGRWQEPAGETLEKYAPRDGTLLCRFGAGEVRQTNEAVSSARRAFDDGRWSKLAPQRRKDVLCALSALILKHCDELALLESLDAGKPIGDALSFDVPTAAAAIEHSAWAADHLYGNVYAANHTGLMYQSLRPLGVVAGLVGWNFPLVLACQKIGPALATGNSLVLKPSEFTSLSAARVAELAVEAGVPEGVLNVIHGDHRVGATLSLHDDVDMLTFTGSTQTGKKLLIASGQSNMKRLVLECGGKAPNIVFEDAPDLDAVAGQVVARAFWNQGQVCTASSRLLVQASLADRFLDRVLEKIAELQTADPLLPDTRLGALVSAEHRRKVLGYVQNAEREGAKMVYRAACPPPFADGFYVPATVFDRVLPAHRIAQEEIFGPVLSVLSFRDEQEAIAIANGTIYGLSAILWTRDLGCAHRMIQAVKAGSITVNATGTPAASVSAGVLAIGGQKQSGMGVEGGIDGLRAYTHPGAVQISF